MKKYENKISIKYKIVVTLLITPAVLLLFIPAPTHSWLLLLFFGSYSLLSLFVAIVLLAIFFKSKSLEEKRKLQRGIVPAIFVFLLLPTWIIYTNSTAIRAEKNVLDITHKILEIDIEKVDQLLGNSGWEKQSAGSFYNSYICKYRTGLQVRHMRLYLEIKKEKFSLIMYDGVKTHRFLINGDFKTKNFVVKRL